MELKLKLIKNVNIHIVDYLFNYNIICIFDKKTCAHMHSTPIASIVVPSHFNYSAVPMLQFKRLFGS